MALNARRSRLPAVGAGPVGRPHPGQVDGRRPHPGRRPRRRPIRALLLALAFLLPGLVLYGTFILGPMLYSLRISFYEWNILRPESSEWIGLANYTRALSDPIFHRAVVNTIAYTAITVPAQIVLGVGIALLLNQAIRGRGLYRVLYYLPVITPWVIVALLFKYLFVGQGGFANYLLRDVIGVIDQNVLWLAHPILIFVPIILLGIWKGVGWGAIIVLAGLQTIPPELEEAAKIDGAGPVARFRYVTLPLLRPILVFLLVVLMIGGLNTYVSNLLITDGGQPFGLTHFVLTLMYQETFTRLDFGYGSAISYLLTVFVFVISVVQIRLLRRKVEL
jgi:multiple sugar transport system permease protein